MNKAIQDKFNAEISRLEELKSKCTSDDDQWDFHQYDEEQQIWKKALQMLEEIKPTDQPLTPKEQEAFDRLNEVWGDDKDGKYKEWYDSKKQSLPITEALPTDEQIKDCGRQWKEALGMNPYRLYSDKDFMSGSTWMKEFASKIIAKKEDMFSRMQNHLLDKQKNLEKEIAELKELLSKAVRTSFAKDDEIEQLKSQIK